MPREFYQKKTPKKVHAQMMNDVLFARENADYARVCGNKQMEKFWHSRADELEKKASNYLIESSK